MSIKDAELQNAHIADRHRKEAQARPDAVHRALIFLLKETRQNNPDQAREIEHHINTLDAELAPGRNPAATADEPDPTAAASGTTEPADETKAPDTAAALKTSKRFQRPFGRT